ncbi:hypothetical protein NOR_04119 [Metarhizium rileyi]|uniref:Uncharacterized protein n=1 Tax=Metarhizium rileyi (strain RCEF 4871) TaxID=1649241 RepID=A0A167EU43_METRR|nr:hypothetical protein NOR_04119 [Metarhizium rileyi RCEF 4871]
MDLLFSLPAPSKPAKRKRIYSVSDMAHGRTKNSINPFSRSPSERRQLSLAGIQDTDEDPTIGVEFFPHRGISRRISEVDMLEEETEPDEEEPEVSQLLAEESLSRTRGERNKHSQKRPNPGHQISQLDTLLRSIHQLLDRGEVTKSARLFGIMLQSRPGSRPIDVRQHNIWAIGAEIIMRGGEDVALLHRGLQYVDIEGGEHTNGLFCGSKEYTRIRIPRKWGSADNVNKMKAFLGVLTQKYPYDHRFPKNISAPDFQLAMLSCEVYSCHATYASANESMTSPPSFGREEVHTQTANRGSEDAYEHEQPELTTILEQPDPQISWQQSRLHAYETLQDISRRMDLLIDGLPYSKNHYFLQLRATVSLLIADILTTKKGSEESITKEAAAAIKSEQGIASTMLQKIIDNGGHTARPLMDLVDQQPNPRETLQQHTLYASLPIRST